ncbi:hypothetical protein JCM9743_15820 [Natrinema sp. JCM 9743]
MSRTGVGNERVADCTTWPDVAVPIYFGAEAEPAITPLLLLLPGALGFALARPILAISQGEGTLRYPVAATGGAALLNLGLNLATGCEVRPSRPASDTDRCSSATAGALDSSGSIRSRTPGSVAQF